MRRNKSTSEPPARLRAGARGAGRGKEGEEDVAEVPAGEEDVAEVPAGTSTNVPEDALMKMYESPKVYECSYTFHFD